jgi:hypothetical protein
LVVKNGSKARAITSGDMPVPVSLTDKDTYCPAGRSRSRAMAWSTQRLPVSIISAPPSGMASRALMQRLSSAFSSWLPSISTVHSPAARTVSIRIAGPMVRRISSSRSAMCRLMSVGFGG